MSIRETSRFVDEPDDDFELSLDLVESPTRIAVRIVSAEVATGRTEISMLVRWSLERRRNRCLA